MPPDPDPTAGTPQTAATPRPGVPRRRLLQVGGAALAGGAVTAATLTAARRGASDEASSPASLEPFHGAHQAGVVTSPQTHAAFAAYTLRRTTDREAARRMMQLVTDDAVRLTAATPVLGDQEPALAMTPARLTITYGFGPDLFDRLALTGRRPPSLRPLPAFRVDRLQPRYSGGDVLAQICADDPMVVAHAVRQVTKTLRTFATTRWVQRGFIQPAAQLGGTGAPRNLMGQVDGTANPREPADFDRFVWSSGAPEWFAGGTLLVLRRIAMNLDTWDELDTAGKELAVGRRLRTGAPLTGTVEADLPDFDATDESGLPVIPAFAHIARAAPRTGAERFLRRPYNYDDAPAEGTGSDSGLLFTAYQADIAAQFLPVQRRLAEQDLMNTWTTPIGSAVFALPPGCQPGGYVGEGLLA